MATGTPPQFETAQFAGEQADLCQHCGKAVGGSYYRIDEQMACATCAFETKNQLEANPQGQFLRALLVGAAGAMAGLILYAAIVIITGYEIGFVSLAVGFIVGKAVLYGSGGVGGRKYQVAAVLFTYFAVAVAIVPVALYQLKDQPEPEQTSAAQSQIQPAAQPAAEQPAKPSAEETSDASAEELSAGSTEEAAEDSAAADTETEAAAQAEAAATPSDSQSEAPPSLGYAMLVMLGIGLAAPFTGLADPVSGIIGLIILLVGMQIAWKLTAAAPVPVVDGPFDNTPPPLGE